jgi:hypothetical protein
MLLETPSFVMLSPIIGLDGCWSAFPPNAHTRRTSSFKGLELGMTLGL